MIVKQHIGKNLLTVAQFDKKKNATFSGVMKAINSDRIEVVLVGKEETIYIDSNKYSNFEFRKTTFSHT